MKEATGELNMTVITIVAIAAVAAFFYAFIWPQIRQTLALTTACNGGANTTGTVTGGSYTCGPADATGAYDCSVEIDGKTQTKKCNVGN